MHVHDPTCPVACSGIDRAHCGANTVGALLDQKFHLTCNGTMRLHFLSQYCSGVGILAFRCHAYVRCGLQLQECRRPKSKLYIVAEREPNKRVRWLIYTSSGMLWNTDSRKSSLFACTAIQPANFSINRLRTEYTPDLHNLVNLSENHN